MEPKLGRIGAWWVILDGEAPLRTPGGTPVVSHHRELLEEVAADVARWGADPTAKTTTYSLQASYLDFGIPVKRSVLEENTAAIWPDDLFVQRPVAPELAGRLAALWGGVDLDRGGFREALCSLTLRQLMATMTAGHVLRTAVVGLRVVATDRDLAPLAMGACGRRFTALAQGTPAEAGHVQVGAPLGRHTPTDADDGYCEGACCAGRALDLDAFRARCALYPLLDKMRRWSAFPEEVRKG